MKKILYRLLRFISAVVFFPITIFVFYRRYSFCIGPFWRQQSGGIRVKQIFLLIVVATFAGFGYWAYHAEFETNVTGQAKLVPSKKLQTVEHFGGGILSEINVEVGQKVEKGEILLKLDPLKMRLIMNHCALNL